MSFIGLVASNCYEIFYYQDVRNYKFSLSLLKKDIFISFVLTTLSALFKVAANLIYKQSIILESSIERYLNFKLSVINYK